MTLPLEALLLPLCRQAGAAIMAVYETDFEASTKDDFSPVTEADLAADRIIVDALSRPHSLISLSSPKSGRRPMRANVPSGFS